MSRPILKIPKSVSDRILINATIYLSIVIILLNLFELYTNATQTEHWLVKYKMIGLSIFSIVLILGSSYLTKHPHMYNYRVTITEENALKEYAKSILAIRFLVLLLLVFFTIISFVHLKQRLGLSITPQFMIFPLIVIVCLLFYSFLYIKAQKKDA